MKIKRTYVTWIERLQETCCVAPRRVAFSGITSNIHPDYTILAREKDNPNTHSWCSVQRIEFDKPDSMLVYTKVKGCEIMRIYLDERARIKVRKSVEVTI